MQHNNKFTLPGKFALYAAAGYGAYTVIRSIYRNVTKFHLQDKVVLITGGSRGLGLVMARQLAARGARLIISSRHADQLASAEQELRAAGADVLAIAADVSDQQEAQRLVETAVTHYGRLDVLINNAGIMIVGPQNVMDIEDYRNAMDSNFWSALYMMKAAVPYFTEQKGGRIVNICSIGGKISVPHLLPYSVSKFAMVALSEGMHSELKKENIKVTTVIPNLMRTGSPGNVHVKGDHEAEYAWFKAADSSPILAQKAEESAEEILEALEIGKAEITLTRSARLAIALQGISPGLVSSLSAMADRFLPVSGDEGAFVKTGFESESEWSNGPVSSLTDRAAIRNNEL